MDDVLYIAIQPIRGVIHVSDQRPQPAVRRLCIKSDLTMEEIAAWDRYHTSKWILPDCIVSTDTNDNDNQLRR